MLWNGSRQIEWVTGQHLADNRTDSCWYTQVSGNADAAPAGGGWRATPAVAGR